MKVLEKIDQTWDTRDSASVRFIKWIEFRSKVVDWSSRRTSPTSSITLTWMYGSFGGVVSCVRRAHLKKSTAKASTHERKEQEISVKILPTTVKSRFIFVM